MTRFLPASCAAGPELAGAGGTNAGPGLMLGATGPVWAVVGSTSARHNSSPSANRFRVGMESPRLFQVWVIISRVGSIVADRTGPAGRASNAHGRVQFLVNRFLRAAQRIERWPRQVVTGTLPLRHAIVDWGQFICSPTIAFGSGTHGAS